MRRLVRAPLRRRARGREDVTAAARGKEAERAKERERLVVPAEGAAARQAGSALHASGPRRHRVSREGTGVLRFRRVAQRGRLAQERRRDDLMFTIDAGVQRLRVRRRGEGRQAHADRARRAARVRLHGAEVAPTPDPAARPGRAERRWQ